MPRARFSTTASCLTALALTLGLSSCGESTPPSEPTKAAAVSAPPAAYTYPPPVSGHVADVNTGTFDLVDGIAVPARGVPATVVYVTSKPIGSPLLARSQCPQTQARALTLLRDAGYVEVVPDAKGRSTHYLEGTPYGGRGRSESVSGREWKISIATADARARGEVVRRDRGRFSFDLALLPPPAADSEVSESERWAAGYASWGGNAPVPTAEQALAAYDRVHAAAAKGDLAAYLERQGFAPTDIESLRGLAGMDADFAAHRDRFLEPGAGEVSTLAAGFASVGARGTNSKGEAFANYYEFTPCGDALVLTSIGLNPQ